MLEEQRPEPKKRKRKIGTIQNLKTAMTARLQTKPRTEAQEYLEMWTLKRDRARWIRAQEQAVEKLVDIDEAIAKLELREEEASSHKPGPPPVTRMPPRETIDFGGLAGRRPRT